MFKIERSGIDGELARLRNLLAESIGNAPGGAPAAAAVPAAAPTSVASATAASRGPVAAVQPASLAAALAASLAASSQGPPAGSALPLPVPAGPQQPSQPGGTYFSWEFCPKFLQVPTYLDVLPGKQLSH